MTMQPDTYRSETTKQATKQASAIFGLPHMLGPVRTNRLLLVLVLAALAAVPGAIGEVTRGSLEDAYIGVSVFVAATLLLFYGAEKVFGFDIGVVFRKARLAQVPLASFLGALPGCGGAVVVVAAYSSGNVSMGAVVAALTATMGDAAFLLIATRPEAALVVLPLSLVVGVISGYVVDLFDKRQFANASISSELAPSLGATRKRDYAYVALALPGLVFGVLGLAQVEFSGLMAQFIQVLALVAITLSMLIWITSPLNAMSNQKDSALTRAAEETSFITAWVVLAFLLFEFAMLAGLDLEAAFKTFGVALPIIAVLVGFIPGCGPQILVTTFYINGLVPFAALIGNAIANDGDALFPAIALNPKVAILATLYSAVPAVLVAYGFFFFLPDFL